MTEIAPNVHWLKAGSSNIYLLVDPPDILLVDTGMPRRQRMVFDLLHSLGHQSEDLTHILITHADLDHAGSLAALQAASGAQVYASADSAWLISSGKSPKHMPAWTQWIIDTFMRYEPVNESVITVVQDGEMLPIFGGLQVLATPGHTLDHVAYFSLASGVLFAGDALNTRNGRINLTPPRITADRTAARQSGTRLLQLSPAVIACGHGAPSTSHSMDDLMNIFNSIRQE